MNTGITTKRLVVALLVGLAGVSGAADASALPTAVPQAGGVTVSMETKGSRVVVTAGALHVRTGPSTRYRSVKVVRRGHVFTTTGRVSGGWTQVDGGRWVSSRYLKKTSPAPAPKPAPTTSGDCKLTVEGVSVTLKKSQQSVTVVKTSGTRATVTMVERKPGTQCGTRQVFRDTTGRIGYGGAVPAASRKQSTGTTPQGSFTVTEAFGLKSNPGTRLPYRVPGKASYWVLDSNSAFYNQWREVSQGGFRTRAGERLRDYPGQYDYAAVIDYNRWPAVKGKGGAIFLHVHGRGATAGCVSVTAANMKNFLRHAGVGDVITIK